MRKKTWHDPHLRHSLRSLIVAMIVTLTVFVSVFILLNIVRMVYVYYISNQSTKGFDSGITKDLKYLKKQGDEVAKNKLLQQYLISKDYINLLDVLKGEKDARSIGLMGVVNSEGVAVSRTMSPKVVGDNVFLTKSIGRAVSKGQSAQSIELTGFPNQLFLTTGRPIINNGQMIGALFANYLADDAYARRFQSEYLPKNVEVLFYTKEYGVYGDSFQDPKIRSLINSYFNTGSDWIVKGTSDKTISFDNGNDFYIIKNIVFPGLEESPGGAILFIPRLNLVERANRLIAILTLGAFLLLAIRLHLRSKGEEKGWPYFTLIIIASIPILALTYYALHSQNVGYLKLKKIPATLYNSTIRIFPDSGVFDTDSEQSFSVRVKTGDESINSVQVVLDFDPDAVEVKKIDIQNSICTYVVENIIDNKNGKIKFDCIILENKERPVELDVIDVVVSPKRAGDFSLSFDKDETKVLANDGLDTNVLRTSQSGTYQAQDFSQSNEDSTSSPIVVFSPTHPNPGRWYNRSKAIFIWIAKPNTKYTYAFDTFPNTIPSGKKIAKEPMVQVPISSDGVFYFHLSTTDGGPVTHYRIQSDQTPPVITSLKSSESTIVVGDVVRFSFDSEDKASGLQRNYYVDFGNHLFLPAGSGIFVPFLEAGDQIITLRVYDDAGNYSEKTVVIHVKKQ